MEYKNWVLTENITSIKTAFPDYKTYANFMRTKGVEFNLDLGLVESFINWDKYPEKYSFWYYYEGCEAAVSEMLERTALPAYDVVYIDFGPRDPVVEVLTQAFIDKWLDFAFGTIFETTVVSPDGHLVMEFRKGDILVSNFEIKKPAL